MLSKNHKCACPEIHKKVRERFQKNDKDIKNSLNPIVEEKRETVKSSSHGFEETKKCFEKKEALEPELPKRRSLEKTESHEIKDLYDRLIKNQPTDKKCCQKPTCSENKAKSQSFTQLLAKNKCCSKRMCKLAAEICEIYKPYVNQKCLVVENLGNFGQEKYHYLLRDASTSYTDSQELKKTTSVKISEISIKSESPIDKDKELAAPSQQLPSDTEQVDKRHVRVSDISKDSVEDYSTEQLEQYVTSSEAFQDFESNVEPNVQSTEQIYIPKEVDRPMDQQESAHSIPIKEADSLISQQSNNEVSKENTVVQIDNKNIFYGSETDSDSLLDITREATEKAAAFRNHNDGADKLSSVVIEDRPVSKKCRVSEPEDASLFKRSEIDLPHNEKKQGIMKKLFKCCKNIKKKSKGSKKPKVPEREAKSEEDIKQYARRTSTRDISNILDPIAAKQQELNNILSNM